MQEGFEVNKKLAQIERNLGKHLRNSGFEPSNEEVRAEALQLLRRQTPPKRRKYFPSLNPKP